MCPPDGPVAQSKNFADSPVLGNCTGIIKKIASGQDMMILPEDSSIYFPLHPLKFLFAFLQSSRFLILQESGLCGHAMLLLCKYRASAAASGCSPPLQLPQRLKWHLIANKMQYISPVLLFYFHSDLSGRSPAPPFATTYAALISIMNSSGVPGLMESAACNGARKYVARRNKCDRD